MSDFRDIMDELEATLCDAHYWCYIEYMDQRKLDRELYMYDPTNSC